MRKIIQIVLLLFILLAFLFPITPIGTEIAICDQSYAVSPDRSGEATDNGRYGSGTGEYVGIDPGKFFAEDGSGDSGLMKGLISLIDFAVTYIMLPVAILMSMWRTIYLAIFPMMAKIDPLDMMHDGRYQNVKKATLKGSALDAGNMVSMNQAISGNTRAILDNMSASKNLRDNTPINSLKKDFFTGAYFDNKSKDKGDLAMHCLKVELRFFFLGMVVTFIAFGLIKLLMQAAILFIQTAGSVAGTV